MVRANFGSNVIAMTMTFDVAASELWRILWSTMVGGAGKLLPYKWKFSRDLYFKNFAGIGSIREI